MHVAVLHRDMGVWQSYRDKNRSLFMAKASVWPRSTRINYSLASNSYYGTYVQLGVRLKTSLENSISLYHTNLYFVFSYISHVGRNSSRDQDDDDDDLMTPKGSQPAEWFFAG